MSYVEADDGIELWVERTGGGSRLPLVLCHGGPGLWDNLGSLAALLDGDRLVVRWDQRGCGRSGGDTGPFTIDQFVADLEAVRRGCGIGQWIVGGHSWGATLALRAVLAFPSNARALLYLSGTGAGHAWHAAYQRARHDRLTPDERDRIAALDAIAQRTVEEETEWRTLRWAPDFADRSQAAELAAIDAVAPWPINYRCNADLNAETESWDKNELLSACSSIAIPTMLLHGAADPRPSEAVADLATAISGAQLKVIEEVGHTPWYERPDVVSAVLCPWLMAVG